MKSYYRFAIYLAFLFVSVLYGIDDKNIYTLARMKDLTANQIEISEQSIAIFNDNYVRLYSIYNPYQPRIETGFFSVHQIQDVEFVGSKYIYISSRELTNTVMEIDSLNVYGKIIYCNSVLGEKMKREGSILYITDRYKGIDIVDIGNGGSNNIKATFSANWGIRDLIAKYPYLYALNDFGLVTVDVTDLNYPQAAGQNYQIIDGTCLRVVNDIAWIGDGKVLRILNVKDINNPRLINQFRFADEIKDIEINNNRIFICLGKGGVRILDCSNPLKLEEKNQINFPGIVYDIALLNDLIILALGRDGWIILEYK